MIEFRGALTFDVFSVGLIFCQLLFNLLDERTDAAFRQQLEESNYDIDIWLERELQSTIRPVSVYDKHLILFSLDHNIHLLKLKFDYITKIRLVLMMGCYILQKELVFGIC